MLFSQHQPPAPTQRQARSRISGGSLPGGRGSCTRGATGGRAGRGPGAAGESGLGVSAWPSCYRPGLRLGGLTFASLSFLFCKVGLSKLTLREAYMAPGEEACQARRQV